MGVLPLVGRPVPHKPKWTILRTVLCLGKHRHSFSKMVMPRCSRIERSLPACKKKHSSPRRSDDVPVPQTASACQGTRDLPAVLQPFRLSALSK